MLYSTIHFLAEEAKDSWHYCRAPTAEQRACLGRCARGRTKQNDATINPSGHGAKENDGEDGERSAILSLLFLGEGDGGGHVSSSPHLLEMVR